GAYRRFGGRIYLQRFTLSKRDYLLLGLIILGFYLFGLGRLPLLGPDEPRYAEVAREMFTRRDLVTPTLGGHTWLEKRALLYWMMMGAFKLFGISEWAARLGPAIGGLLTVLAVFVLGRRVESDELKKLGFWSAFVCGSMLGLIVFSRAASFDIVITMTTTWALTFFVLHLLAESRNTANKLLAGFYAMVGVSLLAKGLVGIVIPFGVIGFFYLLRRTFPTNFLVSLSWGFPLALVIASLWYWPVIHTHGWTFIDEFFVQHHFARFISNKYHHPQPIYFYSAILLLLTLPWTAFLVPALVKSKSWEWRATDSLNTVRVFALAWLTLPILFFSFSGSKLPGYILPVLPASALLVAELVVRITTASDSSRWPMRATGIIYLIFAIGCVIFAVKTHTGYAVIGVGVIGMLMIAINCFVRSGARQEAAMMIGLGSFALVIVILQGAASIAQRESVRE